MSNATTTPKNAELLAKLATIIKEQGLTKGNPAYKLIANALERNCNFIRPVIGSGSGKWSSIHDNTAAVSNLLKKLGIEFTMTNDAPKGGKTGTLIKFV